MFFSSKSCYDQSPRAQISAPHSNYKKAKEFLVKHQACNYYNFAATFLKNSCMLAKIQNLHLKYFQKRRTKNNKRQIENISLGASNINGRISGLQATIKEFRLFTSALFTYYFNHVLNFTAISNVSELKLMSNSLPTICDVCVFF